MIKTRKRSVVDISGQRFGRLVVTERAANLSPRNTRWLCRCDCGKDVIVQGGTLKGGKQQSCGCYHRDAITKHGMEGSRTYRVWVSMRSRCTDKNSKPYANYGGRGISVCESWGTFESFYADMGDAPDGMSIDRIDNSKGYHPGNCRWASMEEQSNNRRTNRILSFQGRNQSLTQWAREVGISPISLKSRISLGWDVEKALTTPIDKRKASKAKAFI